MLKLLSQKLNLFLIGNPSLKRGNIIMQLEFNFPPQVQVLDLPSSDYYFYSVHYHVMNNNKFYIMLIH